MAWIRSKIAIFVITLFTICILIYHGSTEYYRARTYIENVCQVTQSDIDDSNCGEKKDKDCYRPVWAVLFDKPDIDDKPVEGEIHWNSLLSLTQANSRVDQYQVY